MIIDALEERVVATGDVPGAYLHADMKDFTVSKFTGESVDILCKIAEGYRKFVTVEKGKKIMYVRLKKTLYGCVKSAFYGTSYLLELSKKWVLHK